MDSMELWVQLMSTHLIAVRLARNKGSQDLITEDKEDSVIDSFIIYDGDVGFRV